MWYEFLREAYRYAAAHSDDPVTQNGAVLIARDGRFVFACNQFPKGVQATPARLERPAKYRYIEHAERNAIFRAAAQGIQTANARLYVPWFACADCARAIIQAGITEVVGHLEARDRTPERWRESIEEANAMLDEAGVGRYYGSIKLFDDDFTILFNGERWSP